MPTIFRRRTRPSLTFGACAYLALSACNSNGAQDEQPAPAPTSVEERRKVLNDRAPPTPTRAAPSKPEPAAATEVPQLFMALFKEDLARRALVKAEAISVVSAVETTWPDGSLGCGRPGQAYTQAVVRGYRAVLSANAEPYAYHSDLRGNFVVCQQGRALPPLEGQVQSPLDR